MSNFVFLSTLSGNISKLFIGMYIALVVCGFGFLMNTANYVVLAKMSPIKTTSINIVLAGLTLANNVVNTEYFSYSLGNLVYNRQSNERVLTYAWASYVLFHMNSCQVFDMISIWLIFLWAVWHYILVVHPLSSRKWCTRKRAFLAVVATYIVASLSCISFYLSYTIHENTFLIGDDGESFFNPFEEHHNSSITIYSIGPSSLAAVKDDPLTLINLWTLGIASKIIPCFVMAILSVFLICALRAARKQREQREHLRVHISTVYNASYTHNYRLIGMGRNQLGRSTGQQHQETEDAAIRSSLEEDQDRMTRILLVTILLFIITELPQGLLALLSWILGDDFNYECYVQLGDFMDILSLTKSSIDFVLYFMVSRKFRLTFCRIFFSTFRELCTSCWMFGRPVPAASDGNNQPPVAANTTITASIPLREQHQRYATSTV